MANEMRDRLKENISIIKQHNERGLPVKHITKGQKYEVEVIAEIVEDVSLIIEKLENKTLIELPCKVGDTVYFPNEGYHDSAEIERIYIDENGVSFAWVQYDYGPDIVEVWDDGEFSIDEIGKTVFLTIEAKAEAEQKLKEMRGADNG